MAFAGHRKIALSGLGRMKTVYISGGDSQEAPCIYPSDLTDEEWAIVASFFGGRGA